MSSDKRTGKKVPEYIRREDTPGLRLDSGPYIGKIVNNSDPTMSGRLQVWIPDLGAGDDTNPSNWRTVSYASPFFGSTTQTDANTTNAFSKVQHTYGMWFTVPDIGNLVLCTFVAGDPMRGYWFACIPNQLGHHMVPGIAGAKHIDDSTIENADIKKLFNKKKNVAPVVEVNENIDVSWEKFSTLPRPLHEEQLKILFTQGLDEDNVRGTISSSSQRETPSTVFGISTPGRPLSDTDSDVISARKGGHQFVMDDGDIKDKDRLIRLRTAGGHQLLMNDSEKILYIGNINGSAWLEMTGSGHINIYSANSFSIRTQGDLNLHADKDVNINAGGSFNMSAKKSAKMESKELSTRTSGKTMFNSSDFGMATPGTSVTMSGTGGSFSTKGPLKFTAQSIDLNSGVEQQFPVLPKMPTFNLSDTGLKDGKWISTPNSLDSIVKIAPTHEPYDRKTGTPNIAITGPLGQPQAASDTQSASDGGSVTSEDPPTANVKIVECQNNTVGTGSGGVLKDSSGNPVLTGSASSLDAGPKAAASASVSKPVPTSYMAKTSNPNPSSGVGPLTVVQTKALITQIGYSESGGNYSSVNQLNYLGKYQFGVPVLIDQGYIKPDAKTLYGNKATNYPSSWRGKDGVNSKEDFLSNKSAQENAMLVLLKSNYAALLRNKGIKDGDDLCTVAGMLCVSHLLGAGGANTWRKTGSGSDANNTSGATYFNRGRYAVDVLASQS
jgi:hypothetical protein